MSELPTDEYAEIPRFLIFIIFTFRNLSVFKLVFILKKLIVFTLISTLFSCGSVNRTIFGTTEKNLIKTVSIEQNCEKENIKVLERIKGLHGATYSLDACGKRIVYKQVGSVFMESSKVDKMAKELNNK